MTSPTPTSPGTPVPDPAGEALAATTDALRRSRQFATEAANTIGETARDLGTGAADLARTGAESVGEAMVAAQRQLGHYAKATRRQVASDPWKAALVAAAIGGLVTALVLAAFRSPREPD